MTAHQLLARAFHDDPFIRWAEPDPLRRPRTMSHVFAGLLRYAEGRGGHLHEPGIGSAHWRDPGRVHMGALAMLASGSFTVGLVAPPPVWMRLWTHEDAAMKRLEPFLGPDTTYLCALGVEPSLAGQGHGSRLLQAALARMASTWARCVLRTEQPRNRVFYLRNGFTQLDEFVVPASGVPVWTFGRSLRS